MNKPYARTTPLFGLLAAWVLTACLSDGNEGDSGPTQDTASFPADLFFTRLFFLSNDTGFAGTIAGDIYRTGDGGRTWLPWSHLYENVGDAQPHVTGLHFRNSMTAYATSRQKFHTTTNGGTTWSVWGFGNSYDLAVPGGDTLFAVGEHVPSFGHDVFFRSTNGGAAWSTTDLYPGMNVYWRSISCPTSLTCYAGGWDDATNSQASLMAKTSDGGATWTPLSVTGTGLATVYCTNADLCHRSTNGTTERTTDGGVHWAVTAPFSIKRFHFTDSANGHAIGGTGTLSQDVLLRTTDAGATWTSQRPLGKNAYLSGLAFPSSLIGYVSAEGKLLKTTNGGASWRRL